MTSQSPGDVDQQQTKPSESNSTVVPEKRKRSKYIAKACNECKRRKIRCNGQQPCQRCGRRMVECIYAVDSSVNDSQNIEQLLHQVQSLQEQVKTLSGTVDTLVARDAARSSGFRSEPFQRPIANAERGKASSGQQLSFHGPTTSSFSFGIARQSLQTRGITELGDEGEATQEPSPMPSPSLSPQTFEYQQSIDPLWAISKEEGIRLCRVYEEEMGIMYPILELEQTISHVNALYTHLRTPSLSRSSHESAYNPEQLDNDDINILKLVFACALTAEESGHSELGMRIFNSVRDVANDSIWSPPDIKRAIFLTLMIDEETLAWRTIGTVVRMCLEMGLHRRETFTRPAILAFGRERVLKLFWSVYTLDMRWSIGTGMPFHLDHSDIDPSLPQPNGVPYLTAMIGYSRIAEKVWKFIASSSSSNEIKKDEMAYLDWQVLQWAKSIPDSLKLVKPQSTQSSTTDYPNRGIRRLQCLLYLRANLMRMLIYRPVLHTGAQMARNPVEATTAVEIAKDTIQFITQLNKTSDIYQLQQVAFNWFLVSAVAVLFLAVAHAPAQFNSQCKDEFYMALELVKGFSMKSYISQRLWKSIKSLRKLAPQIGLQKSRRTATDCGNDTNDRTVDGYGVVNSQEPVRDPGPQDEFLLDGTQMSRELMDWFEAMGESGNSTDVPNLFNVESLDSGESYMSGYGSELASILKDCF
ncbi:C6 transcription factor [Rasamsonia emersonii CBS 393.64]|uniref:C6 transcription factor n=1 Tax=Rasamsonia emersonii (strain ATCC 16479 / CBS 393.64 / IMI 116815) TaxID=1408163 RepID=A0A0F4YNJ1_RASE3|nr:C6 transcription factor [Rasamsonia emersonii CBS 393.64]KKA19809.1 C6 transcription factor [Rasamsonia emersonii CBS 393.64]